MIPEAPFLFSIAGLSVTLAGFAGLVGASGRGAAWRAAAHSAGRRRLSVSPEGVVRGRIESAAYTATFRCEGGRLVEFNREPR